MRLKLLVIFALFTGAVVVLNWLVWQGRGKQLSEDRKSLVEFSQASLPLALALILAEMRRDAALGAIMAHGSEVHVHSMGRGAGQVDLDVAREAGIRLWEATASGSIANTLPREEARPWRRTSSAFISALSGPIEKPSPMTSRVTPWRMSL